ncbi:FHA domain-containing protein [Rhodoblastus sp.]|uniref:FHA domain-containing protein n=1 Tax=Rhodoblastus sp. TaxID=1962975 RepID=UPI003F9D775F
MATYPCPKNGCASTDPDWCSECGANMHPGAAPASAATATLCPDCGTPRDAQDEWCGVCRYNFKAGKSFSPVTAASQLPVSADPPSLPTGARTADVQKATTLGEPKGAWYVVIEFDASVDPGLDASQIAPRPTLTFPLDLAEMRIGRKGGRDHPELPLDDEGVSSRHAKISFTADGDPILLDLNSTNGTVVNDAPIAAGIPVALASGDVIKLGRWTRITVRAR